MLYDELSNFRNFRNLSPKTDIEVITGAYKSFR